MADFPTSDIAMQFGSPLEISEDGDFGVVAGITDLEYRVVRRLLSNTAYVDENGNTIAPPDYIWEPEYGGNLRLSVDRLRTVENKKAIQTRTLDQMHQEAEVADSPTPTIIVSNIPNGVSISIGCNLANGTVLSIPEIEIVS